MDARDECNYRYTKGDTGVFTSEISHVARKYFSDTDPSGTGYPEATTAAPLPPRGAEAAKGAKRKAEEPAGGEPEFKVKKKEETDVDVSAAKGSCRVFVGNMAWAADQDSVAEFFAQRGEATDVQQPLSLIHI